MDLYRRPKPRNNLTLLVPMEMSSWCVVMMRVVTCFQECDRFFLVCSSTQDRSTRVGTRTSTTTITANVPHASAVSTRRSGPKFAYERRRGTPHLSCNLLPTPAGRFVGTGGTWEHATAAGNAAAISICWDLSTAICSISPFSTATDCARPITADGMN